MNSMPMLSTGAVQQYPYVCGTAGRTRVLQFADGTEQRFQAAPQRRTWWINLQLLGEAERAAFLAFAQNAVRSEETFAFTDPTDGAVYPACRVAIAPVSDFIDGVARAGVEFMISEVAA